MGALAIKDLEPLIFSSDFTDCKSLWLHTFRPLFLFVFKLKESLTDSICTSTRLVNK